jgi:hypothetical protein
MVFWQIRCQNSNSTINWQATYTGISQAAFKPLVKLKLQLYPIATN